eukprot:CAMPEP_0194065954 /NCGR_PEP_ID=MMETSP0009_2-20130614/85754_1 /TAXON_ID=210454 /ORGANISM="Grammatophora oceanica, Strain CCMP 410" /LENGTH=473 /DNA_ID=CAMNT_0038718855 /DNA_START=123 /DNA_END=1544 /DNA_ORIENTATION=-
MAGIGGGGLLFPILTLVMHFDAKQGAVLGNAGVFGNASGQVLWNHVLSPRRSSQDTTTIFEVALLILPTLVAGGSWALVLVGLIPSTVLLLLAVATLSFATIKTFLKATQMRKQQGSLTAMMMMKYRSTPFQGDDDDETNHQQMEDNHEEDSIQQQQQEARDDRDQQGAMRNETVTSTTTVNASTTTATTAAVVEEGRSNTTIRTAYKEAALNSMMMPPSQEEEDEANTTTTKLWIAFFWFLNMSIFLAEHFVSLCSPFYFVLISIPTTLAILFVLWRRRSYCNYPIGHGNNNDDTNEMVGIMAEATTTTNGCDTDATANPATATSSSLKSSLLLPTLSFGIGFLAALLGIGGGELIGPMLLMLSGTNSALDPTITSAITALLSWLNSTSNQVHNIALGRITSNSYTIAVCLIGFLGGLGGRSWVASSSSGDNNKKKVTIAYSLLTVLCIGTMLLIWELATSKPEWQPKGMCV